VPNRQRAIVSFKEMVTLKEFQASRMEIPIALGKGISGEPQLVDLVQTPHLLIAGATGSGKSVCVNSIICSILYGKSPEEVRFVLIDPKIVELKAYNDIPHLLTPVVTEPKRAFQVLQYCIEEMERRYSMLDYTGVRDIRGYNRKAAKQKLTIQHLPYWVVVVDEFADLIATTGKEMEAVLARLAAMARAVGIHLVLATQRPSIDVITGLIKANIPSRIAFMVASKFDSRIIIDAVGAEKLLGQGDMLFCPAWDPIPARIQGTYLSDEEVEAITAHARTLGEPEYLDESIFTDEDEEWTGEGSEDPLMDKALEIVLAAGKASASYLQRRLKVGYNRAARLVEEMERMGIVGPAQGSKPREVLHVPER
jgi:S-DNA-T family DNA segregation ATPase FtsK/SpoIIIE